MKSRIIDFSPGNFSAGKTTLNRQKSNFCIQKKFWKGFAQTFSCFMSQIKEKNFFAKNFSLFYLGHKTRKSLFLKPIPPFQRKFMKIL